MFCTLLCWVLKEFHKWVFGISVYREMKQDIPVKKESPELTKRQSDESIQTSPTLRAKGKAISRFFISIIKICRMCKKNKKKQ